ncbi:hypothetical protein ISF9_008 [Microbacterium phage vB_MoxS-ISF9]|uniref:Uncharacterized protein n=1 Tax=Microbacterium phage vB_MoxS-ISF9 TaxID=1458670 RepID=W8NWJ3_9CAUD|nr:hypothetical protein ISF9_008 [Microbacterium phage vB_MoxS-ISF9]AHL18478.1 hypothetical protein ISF9_008 [Microbacterium phage vB_MoxS-ISF9]
MPTTPGGRWSPNNGDGYDLITHLAAMQVSNESATGTEIQAVKDTIKTYAPTVNSDAARTAAYPNPVQGDRVWRSDKGWEEAYFGLYNASTNPSGSAQAGWYPVAGVLPYGGARNSASQTLTANQNLTINLQTASKLTGGFTLVSNALRIPITGRYSARGYIYTFSIGSGTNRIIRIANNGVEVSRFTQNGPWTIGPVIAEFDANAGDMITMTTNGDSTITNEFLPETTELLGVRYMHPKVGA